MGNAKRYRPPPRAKGFRRRGNGTSLPFSLRKELRGIEDSFGDQDSTASSDGSGADSPRSLQPQQRQLSRKERRKQLRRQRQQQKHEHQRDRKRQRTAESSEPSAPLKQQKKKQQKTRLPPERTAVKARQPDATEYHGREISESDSASESYGVSADSGSIGAAAALLKQEQQQQRGVDRLQDEMHLLEKRLYSHQGREDTEESRARRRKKLREELQQDGFDFELQDILDDILGTGEGRTEATGSDAEGSGVDGVSSDASSDGADGESESDEGSAVSETETGDSNPEDSLSVSKGRNATESAVSPQVYVAPHRRLQDTGTAAPTSTSLVLEAVKVEVVRALNRVSEGNAEPVLRQLLRVLRDNAADLRRQTGSGKEAAEVLRLYTSDVRQLLCEQLMQSCIKSRFSTNSLIATQTALCCALSKMWDMNLCRDFLGALATCFSTSFMRALAQRARQQEAPVADTSSLITRHATVGVCCLYDFGFVSSRLFVELVRRVAGLDRCSQGTPQCSNKLTDFQVELLLLMLRLGGGKLRQDDVSLFTTTWKELQGLVHGGAQPQALGDSLALKEGVTAEAGRLRALLLELQDLKAGKQKDRLMLIKASQDAMRRWLSSSAVFGSVLLSTQFQIDGSWAALERGQQPDLSRAAAAAAQLQHLQHSQAESAAAAPDAASVGAAAIDIQHKAALLRFNTELQQSLFRCLMMANDADDALLVLQNSGHLGVKKDLVRLIRLTEINGHWNVSAIIWRHPHHKVRLGVTDLRIIRFLNFDSSAGEEGPMGLSGKLGIFLREVCTELLCCPTEAASPLPAAEDWEESAAGYFKCLRPMTDICEAFITLLQDVVLPIARGRDTADAANRNKKRSGGESKALKASVVKSTIRALLAYQQLEA